MPSNRIMPVLALPPADHDFEARLRALRNAPLRDGMRKIGIRIDAYVDSHAIFPMLGARLIEASPHAPGHRVRLNRLSQDPSCSDLACALLDFEDNLVSQMDQLTSLLANMQGEVVSIWHFGDMLMILPAAMEMADPLPEESERRHLLVKASAGVFFTIGDGRISNHDLRRRQIFLDDIWDHFVPLLREPFDEDQRDDVTILVPNLSQPLKT